MGLPREGKAANTVQLGDVVRREVPTCRLTERIGDVRPRLEAGGWDLCVVVNDQRIVLGVLRKKALESASTTSVESVMDPGPATYRPDRPVSGLLDVMRQRDLHGYSLVTTPKGVLIGTISRDQAEQAIAGTEVPG